MDYVAFYAALYHIVQQTSQGTSLQSQEVSECSLHKYYSETENYIAIISHWSHF